MLNIRFPFAAIGPFLVDSPRAAAAAFALFAAATVWGRPVGSVSLEGADGSDRAVSREVIAPGPESSYFLGPDDAVTVHVLGSEEVASAPLRIGPRGYLSMPLAGRVAAAGRTVEQLEELLRERLKTYIRDPQVSVGVAEFRSRPVSVLGAVNRPGVHQVEGRKSLVEMLSLAGGVSQEAGPWVKITRRVESGVIPLPGARTDVAGRFSVAEVRLGDLLEARRPELNIPIQPRDVIAVPRADMVYVIGGVNRAGRFVLNDRESVTVLQALAPTIMPITTIWKRRPSSAFSAWSPACG